MGRRQWTFDEPAAKVVVTIDTTLKPPQIPPVPRKTPQADALTKIIADYIAEECDEDINARRPRVYVAGYAEMEPGERPPAPPPNNGRTT